MTVIPLDDERTPRRPWEWTLGVIVVLACSMWVAYRLHPSLILRDTTTNGGDMGAHVYWPWFLEHHWFTQGRLQGWSPSWYSGFPIGQYYFPFPAVLTALFDLVLPYNVAFKIVTVLGPILLPVAAYALAEQLEFPWPASPLASVATLYYQFDVRRVHGQTTWTIYGGNLASGLAGEYSFTLALALALFFVAAFAFTLRTGRRPWLAILLLACCVMSHIVVAMFAVFLAVLVWLTHRPWRTWRIAVPVGMIAALLTFTWSIPLVATAPYTSSMRYEKVTEYANWLFGPGTSLSVFGVAVPLPSPVWLWALVLCALIGGAFWLRRCTLVVVVWATTFGLAFRYWPADLAVWNTRFIPFYFLALALLAALGVAEVLRLTAYLVRATVDRAADRVVEPEPVDAILVDGDSPDDARDSHDDHGVVGDTILPAPVRRPSGREVRRRRAAAMSYTLAAGLVAVSIVTVIAADNQGRGIVSYWAEWNYSGYEAKGASWTEFSDLMARMRTLGRTTGCGRALWEPSAGTVDGQDDPVSRYGTPLALELLPYFTNDCIGSQEGLYFESSATKDAHFLMVSELAEHPSNPVRGLLYGSTADFARGIDHARMLGVRYLMFWSPESKAKAANSPTLRRVLSTADLDSYLPKGWEVYEIKDWGLVAGLDTEPVVATVRAGTQSTCWPGQKPPIAGQSDAKLDAWECASDPWWMDASALAQPFAADGPPQWRRVRLDKPGALDDLPPRPVTPAVVSDVHQSADTIRFHVDRLGSPVVVRSSWFPNWRATGADGPYRLSPNLMVVVPTSHDVTLEYGLTGADWVGRIGTLLGIVLFGLVIWRFPQVPARWTTQGDASDEPADDSEPDAEGPGPDGQPAPDEPDPTAVV